MKRLIYILLLITCVFLSISCIDNNKETWEFEYVPALDEEYKPYYIQTYIKNNDWVFFHDTIYMCITIFDFDENIDTDEKFYIDFYIDNNVIDTEIFYSGINANTVDIYNIELIKKTLLHLKNKGKIKIYSKEYKNFCIEVPMNPELKIETNN